MNYKAIIFDLDGTLINSAQVWIDIDKEYAKKFGLEIPDNYLDIIKPMGFAQLAVYYAEVLGVPQTAQEIMADWNRMADEKYRYHVELKPYAKEFIEKQHALGVRMCIATANVRELTEAALHRLGILEYMEFVMNCDEIGCGKDTPEIYIKSAEKLGVSARDAVVFEDMLHGIKSAAEGGFDTVAVLDGMFGADDEEEIIKLATRYIRGYDELL